VAWKLLPAARITHMRPCIPPNHCKTIIMTSEIQCVKRSQRRQPSPSSTLMDIISAQDVNCSSHQRKRRARTHVPSGTSIHKPKAKTRKIEPYTVNSAFAALSCRAKLREIQAVFLDAIYSKCGQCSPRDRDELLAASPAGAGLRRSWETLSSSLEGNAQTAPRGLTFKRAQSDRVDVPLMLERVFRVHSRA
jgi:hypothetical protein